MLQRLGVAATLIVVLLPASFAVPSLRQRSRGADLRFVITSWPTAQLVRAAEARGFFARYGLRVAITDVHDDYRSATLALRSNQADGGVFALADPFVLTAGGEPVKVVATVDYSAGADGIVATEEVATVGDLKGRRVASPPQGLGDLLLDEALRRAALTEADVVVVPRDPLGGVRAFLAREVDAVVTAEPFLSLAASRRSSRLLFSSVEAPGLIPDVIVFRSPYVAEHPREVAAFLRGWFDLIDDLGQGVAQRQEALAVVAIASGTSLADVEREFLGIKLLDFADNAVAFTYGDDSTSLYGSSARLLDFLAAAGELREPIELTAVLDPSLIRRGLRDE